MITIITAVYINQNIMPWAGLDTGFPFAGAGPSGYRAGEFHARADDDFDDNPDDSLLTVAWNEVTIYEG